VNQTHDVTLQTLVEVMGLQTAWIFLSTETGLTRYIASPPAPHDFALCAACGLPLGLLQNNDFYLREPPDCHCQALLRKDLLTRAVNVVECTRLQDAVDAWFARNGPKLRAAHLLFLPVFKAYSSHYSSASCPFYTARSIGRQFATSGAESVDTRTKGLYTPLTSFTE